MFFLALFSPPFGEDEESDSGIPFQEGLRASFACMVDRRGCRRIKQLWNWWQAAFGRWWKRLCHSEFFLAHQAVFGVHCLLFKHFWHPLPNPLDVLCQLTETALVFDVPGTLGVRTPAPVPVASQVHYSRRFKLFMAAPWTGPTGAADSGGPRWGRRWGR